MFCGNVVGQFLPPMVVYKSENLYKNWVINGVAQKMWFMKSHLVVGLIGLITELLKSVFFYFEIWFVPAVAGKGKVALIGDNLGAHFSKAVMINVWKIIYFSYVCHQMQHIFASH